MDRDTGGDMGKAEPPGCDSNALAARLKGEGAQAAGYGILAPPLERTAAIRG